MRYYTSDGEKGTWKMSKRLFLFSADVETGLPITNIQPQGIWMRYVSLLTAYYSWIIMLHIVLKKEE
jgi:hypothetical protein